MTKEERDKYCRIVEKASGEKIADYTVEVRIDADIAYQLTRIADVLAEDQRKALSDTFGKGLEAGKRAVGKPDPRAEELAKAVEKSINRMFNETDAQYAVKETTAILESALAKYWEGE